MNESAKRRAGWCFAILAVLLGVSTVTAQPRGEGTSATGVPASLSPWVDWVLDGAAQPLCPLGRDGERRCAWPGDLVLAVDASGGRFSQRVRVYADAWLSLPGQPGAWPEAVTANGEPVAVTTGNDERPRVRLTAGENDLAGEWRYSRPPDYLRLPAVAGPVRLTLNGAVVARPDIDADGRLWLARRAPPSTPAPAAAVAAQVFMRLRDAVPLRLDVRVELDVAGAARALTVPGLVLDGFVPVALDSEVPARLDADGNLRLQVRPGRVTVTLRLLSEAPVARLERPAFEAPLPVDGLLSFAADPGLRTVTVQGLRAVDPTQTRLPDAWRSLPTYRFAAGDAVELVERSRGDSGEARDRLSVDRTLWLDFDGRGFTALDLVQGALRASSRIDAGPGLDVGRVEVDDTPRPVTQLQEGGPTGVEVQRGPLRLRAESRIEGEGAGLARGFDAIGWDVPANELGLSVELPPGWRLLHASGADAVSHSWLSRWTLLELFVVLVGAVAAMRLYGVATGVLGLVTLALTLHEPGAPRWVWLNVLAAAALCHVLPRGRLLALAGLYRLAAAVALVVIAVPFATDQMTRAFFPQLERAAAWTSASRSATSLVQSAPAPRRGKAVLGDSLEQAAEVAGVSLYQRYDPDARLQTGPGLPDWRWTRARLGWSGPVATGESVRLFLLSPPLTRAARALAVALLVALALVLLRGKLRLPAPTGPTQGKQAAIAMLAAAGLGLGLATMPPASMAQAPESGAPTRAASDFPPVGLLDALRERLTRPPACAPRCASIPLLGVEYADGALRLRVEAHAQARVEVPLPGASLGWQPERVVLDGAPAQAVLRAPDGSLSLPLEPGVHTVLLEGRVAPHANLALPLPLRPRRVVARLEGGARLGGLRADGQPAAQLLLEFPAQAGTTPARDSGGSRFAPRVEVRRDITLGVDWRVETQVRRLSAPAVSIALDVPLLPGEAVLSERGGVSDSAVRVVLAPGTTGTRWSSSLPVSESLALVAAQDAETVEVWTLDAAPQWHVERDGGIAPDFAQGAAGRSSTWRPWPGESLTLSVVRPAAAPGPTLTARAVRLDLVPGARSTAATLTLDLNGSRGVEHPLTLPAGARLDGVQIDGVAVPPRVESGRVIVPLSPGAHVVVVRYGVPRGIDAFRYVAPELDAGLPAVNTTVTMQVPESRWLLWAAGPRVGPAVVFWALLALVAVLALVLARSKLTPLGPFGWFALGIGLTQVSAPLALVVVGWLFALGWRGRDALSEFGPWRFGALQVLLVLLTLVALGVIFTAISAGLLGTPEMQVRSFGSHARSLAWFDDRGPGTLPTVEVFSVPILYYRLAMLGWALWVAFALVRWLGWGWRQFTRGGYWRPLTWPRLPFGGRSATGAQAPTANMPSRS